MAQQFGMQMPTARGKKGATPNVYTGLAAVACVCLAAACLYMFFVAGAVGKDGNPLGIQDKGSIKIKSDAR